MYFNKNSVSRFPLRPGFRIGILSIVLGCGVALSSASFAADGDWPHYAADGASSKYSALDQINADNVNDLEEAWRWNAKEVLLQQGERAPRNAGTFKTTPIVVNGVMYFSTHFSQIVAMNPGSGEVIWSYDPDSFKEGRPANSGFQHRGVEYWTDGTIERILIATGGRQLVSVDAKTGKPDPNFGVNGITDLTEGLGKEFNKRSLGYNAPPVVCRDTIILGSIISDSPSGKAMPPGSIRGFDVRTGKQKWIFHTIPQEGEYGNETWENDSWKYSGNTNAWSMLSVDEDLGYVYLPIGTPTSDWYGEFRHGDNLFGESLLCLNAETGERVWHFQLVHHGLWDYDPPAAPNLVDIVVDGKAIKAVAQVSKQGFTYVFDRVTGEPVWPIEERPVPQSDVPGEKTAATQPFPTKPPAFERQGVTEDDLIDFTPELRAKALEIMKNYTIGPLYTPPSVISDTNKGTLMLPSPAGGANWMGACVDPETGVMYVPSMTWIVALALREQTQGRSEFSYNLGFGDFAVPSVEGLPLMKPPYGRITAIDLNKGDIKWQVPHGQGPTDNPAIKHLNLGPLGAATNGGLSNGGGFVTKTLLFMNQPDPDSSNMLNTGLDGVIRAYSKEDGKQLWEHRLGKTPRGTPMTYMYEGEQYIVVAVGGQFHESELVALKLKK